MNTKLMKKIFFSIALLEIKLNEVLAAKENMMKQDLSMRK